MADLTLFVDLDDTLFQTREKALLRAAGGPLVAAALDREGAPLSYHAPDQLALLGLFAGCVLIPVTGRNREALDRVTSPRFADYRITSHGAAIYAPDGSPLASWGERTGERARRLAEPIVALAAALSARFIDGRCDVRVRAVQENGLPVYVSVKAATESALPDSAAVFDTAQATVPEVEWTLHRNGHNLAILPPYASKADAVAHLIEIKRATDPRAVFVGAGDSLTDLPYLKLCDFALIPRGSQIQEVLWG